MKYRVLIQPEALAELEACYGMAGPPKCRERREVVQRLGAAVIIGSLIVAFVGVVGVEVVSSILHPFPPGVDPMDIEACKQHVARYPTGVLLLCAIGWWVTVFASCWMATRLGIRRHAAHGVLVGAILLSLAVYNMAMLPYPVWFWINVVAFPASCFVGIRLARRGMVVH